MKIEIKRKLILLAFLSMACVVGAVQYQKSDSLKVVKLLNEARARKLTRQQDCVMFFTRQFYGIPYVASTLEVNKKEQLVVNLRQLDCTTYVENVVALTLCVKNKQYTFRTFCDNLKLIRYRKGDALSYPARLHYYTEWIDDNAKAGICREIQSPNPPFTKVQNIFVNYMSAHSDKYPMLKGNAADREKIAKMEKNLCGRKYRYIPKTAVRNTKLLRQTIHNGDIIAIITNKSGLDTQHLGFAVWHKDGLHLINASSVHHKVVEEPMLLYTYLQKRKTMTGIRIVRLSD